MPPQKKPATIHGVSVTQLQLQGKYYTPVDGRIKIAEQADPTLIRRAGAGYHVIAVQFVQMGERWAYHCLVEYPAGSGVVKPGTDFIDMQDPSGVAKAETSAIGRALGLHGIAIEESIASAEEMSRVGAASADEQEAQATTTQATQATQATQRATTGGKASQASKWATVDGYDPISDMALRARVKALGVNNMADYEALLADVRAHYRVYDRAAIDAEVRVREGRLEAAREKVAMANGQASGGVNSGAANGGGHDLHEAFPAGQRGA